MIAAEGEQKASRALREASEVIGDSPAALQLRYLQVRQILLTLIWHLRLIYYYRSNVLSIIYYCRHYPSISCIFFLILDTEHDIGGEEFYHCVPATNWYADLFYESFTERIIVQKNVAFARCNNRKRRMIFFFKIFRKQRVSFDNVYVFDKLAYYILIMESCQYLTNLIISN